MYLRYPHSVLVKVTHHNILTVQHDLLAPIEPDHVFTYNTISDFSLFQTIHYFRHFTIFNISLIPHQVFGSGTAFDISYFVFEMDKRCKQITVVRTIKYVIRTKFLMLLAALQTPIMNFMSEQLNLMRNE